MSYIYRHIRLDTNQPFYIGVGLSDECGNYRSRSKSKRSVDWNSIVNKAGYRVDIIMDGLAVEQAFEKEMEFISLYGRSDLGTGILINKTSGGQGKLGAIMSNEQKDKIRLRMKGKYSGKKNYFYGKKPSHRIGVPLSIDHKEKISNANKCKKLTDEAKRAIGYAPSINMLNNQHWLGRSHKEKSKAKISAANTGRVISEETRVKLRISHTGIKASEETKEKFRRNMIGNKYSLGRTLTDENKKAIQIAQMNRPKKPGCSSEYKGVCFAKKSKLWSSRVKVNKKTISLGFYSNEVDAAKAYNKKVIELYGHGVILNNV